MKHITPPHQFLLLMALLIPGGNAFSAETVSASAGTSIMQQNQICKGVIKDTDGNPVIGASVLIQGTMTGAITDVDGSFSLPEAEAGNVLLIQCLGYKDQLVNYDGNPVNAILEFDTQMIEDTAHRKRQM